MRRVIADHPAKEVFIVTAPEEADVLLDNSYNFPAGENLDSILTYRPIESTPASDSQPTDPRAGLNRNWQEMVDDSMRKLRSHWEAQAIHQELLDEQYYGVRDEDRDPEIQVYYYHDDTHHVPIVNNLDGKVPNLAQKVAATVRWQHLQLAEDHWLEGHFFSRFTLLPSNCWYLSPSW